MNCSVTAYRGKEPYIFVSYCHQDQSRVYPYIEMLAADGYRMWYDEGITPGDEWVETIAKHLEGSSVFIAFITEASMNSHNCRREINYAIQRNKNFVALFLDDVKLSRGMEMILSSIQGIYRSQYPIAEDFIRKLCSMPVLDQCQGEKQPQLTIMEDLIDNDETVTLTQGIMGFAMGDTETYLQRVKNLEKIYIRTSVFSIGRSRSHSDYAISGDISVSRKHATIHRVRDAYMIVDNKSLNHVGINGRLIPPEVEYELNEFDVVSLAKEHMVFFRDFDEKILRMSPGFILQDDRGNHVVGEESLTRLGSTPLQTDGSGCEICIDEPGILPVHAFLITTPGGLYAVDLSGRRATAVNGRPLLFCEKTPLMPGDTLTIGDHSFEVIQGI